MIGLPIVILLLPATWMLLVSLHLRGVVADSPRVTELLAEQKRALGTMRVGERLMFVIFGITALAWIMREPKTIGTVTVPGLATILPSSTDTTIAITAAILLFVVPGRDASGKTRPLLTWRE